MRNAESFSPIRFYFTNDATIVHRIHFSVGSLARKKTFFFIRHGKRIKDEKKKTIPRQVNVKEIKIFKQKRRCFREWICSWCGFPFKSIKNVSLHICLCVFKVLPWIRWARKMSEKIENNALFPIYCTPFMHRRFEPRKMFVCVQKWSFFPLDGRMDLERKCHCLSNRLKLFSSKHLR